MQAFCPATDHHFPVTCKESFAGYLVMHPFQLIYNGICSKHFPELFHHCVHTHFDGVTFSRMRHRRRNRLCPIVIPLPHDSFMIMQLARSPSKLTNQKPLRETFLVRRMKEVLPFLRSLIDMRRPESSDVGR